MIDPGTPGKAAPAAPDSASDHHLARPDGVDEPTANKNELLPLVVTREEARHGSTGIALELPWASENLHVWIKGGKSAGDTVTMHGKGPLDSQGNPTDLRCVLRVIEWTLPDVKSWSSWRGWLSRGDLSIGEGRLLIVRRGQTCTREAIVMLSNIKTVRPAYSWHRGNYVEVLFQLNNHTGSTLKLQIMAGTRSDAVLVRLQQEMKRRQRK